MDLVFSELSLVVGRPASVVEMEGGVYSGPASMTVGGKLLIKSKDKTFDSELELAIATGNTGRIDSWVTRLAGLCQDSDYPFAPIFTSNLLKFLMKAKQNLKQDGLVLAYMREHRGARSAAASRSRTIPSSQTEQRPPWGTRARPAAQMTRRPSARSSAKCSAP